MYELMTEIAMSTTTSLASEDREPEEDLDQEPVDIMQWTMEYVLRRYGLSEDHHIQVQSGGAVESDCSLKVTNERI